MNILLDWLGDHRNRSRIFVIIFIVALATRLVALLAFPETHLSGNAVDSILQGAELIRTGQFLDNPDYPMLIPPLTALFTAAIQSIFGATLLPVKLAQVAMDAATVALVYWIGIRTLGQAVAAIGAAVVAVYPFSVFVPLYIGTETLFTFLLALFLLLFLQGVASESLKFYLASGVVLGLATLTRGTTLFLPAVLLLCLFWLYRGRPHGISGPIKATAVLLLGFAVTLSPWVVRNHLVLGAFIPASTSHGPMLHGSSERFWLIADRERELPKYVDYLKNERGITGPTSAHPTWVEKDRFYRQAALEMYKERWEKDPWSYVPFVAKKFLRLWYGTESGSNTAIVIGVNLPIYLLALVGLVIFLRRSARDNPGYVLLALLAYFVAIHVAVFGYFRYMVPVMPYVILFAAAGATGLLRAVQGYRPERS